jgi:hypothetical protein
MAIFYEGPYIKADGTPSKQMVIGRLHTTSRTLTTIIAKALSREGRSGIVVTAHVPEKRFRVRASKGRVVKIPAILQHAYKAQAKTSRKPKVSRHAKLRVKKKTSRKPEPWSIDHIDWLA